MKFTEAVKIDQSLPEACWVKEKFESEQGAGGHRHLSGYGLPLCDTVLVEWTISGVSLR